jgi:hypothetical protein
MRQRTWMWVGIGMLVSTMLIGGVAFAAGQRVPWQVPQASVKAPEVAKSLQPVAVQGSDRGSIGQELRVADGGDRPGCRGKKC